MPEVFMYLAAPEWLFRLKYITVHIFILTYEVSQALGKYTFIEYNKSIIFKTIIDNNFSKKYNNNQPFTVKSHNTNINST